MKFGVCLFDCFVFFNLVYLKGIQIHFLNQELFYYQPYTGIEKYCMLIEVMRKKYEDAKLAVLHFSL